MPQHSSLVDFASPTIGRWGHGSRSQLRLFLVPGQQRRQSWCSTPVPPPPSFPDQHPSCPESPPAIKALTKLPRLREYIKVDWLRVVCAGLRESSTDLAAVAGLQALREASPSIRSSRKLCCPTHDGCPATVGDVCVCVRVCVCVCVGVALESLWVGLQAGSISVRISCRPPRLGIARTR